MIAMLFGPPGSGKGTQSGPLARALGVPHVSTGDMLRQEIERGTPLGREAEPVIRSGALVSDDILIRMIEQRLNEPDASSGVLLDGFPRTVAQAQALDAMLERRGTRVGLVVLLEVDGPTLLSRIEKRGREEGRSDDNASAFQVRMDRYNADTAPILEYYRRTGTRVTSVDGLGTPDEVRDRISTAVESSMDGLAS